MDRLTGKHYDRGDYYMECSGSCANDDEMCGGCPWIEKIINRLGAYEDTGLEPDDVTDLMAAHGTAILKLSEYRALGPAEHIRELVQAEKDGRLVVLPCKVGDTVYQASADRIYESKIKMIIFDTDNIAFDERAIGKSIFLTREEAEMALKGGGN